MLSTCLARFARGSAGARDELRLRRLRNSGERRVPVEKTAATVATEQLALAKLVPDLRAHAHPAAGALLILGAGNASAAAGYDAVKMREPVGIDRCAHCCAVVVKCGQFGRQLVLASGN